MDFHFPVLPMRKGLPKGRPFQVDYDGTPYFLLHTGQHEVADFDVDAGDDKGHNHQREAPFHEGAEGNVMSFLRCNSHHDNVREAPIMVPLPPKQAPVASAHHM